MICANYQEGDADGNVRDESNVESVERIAACGNVLEACLFNGTVVGRGIASVKRVSVNKPNEMLRLSYRGGIVREGVLKAGSNC